MNYVNANGTKIPSLGFGTYRVTGNDALQIVPHALDIGFRHIDTAQIYENEKEIGKGIKASSVARNDIFLTTKVWIDNYAHNTFLESVNSSLRNLQTDYIDLLLLHWPSSNKAPLSEQIGALNEVQKQGKVRHIGVSNFTVKQMKNAVELSSTPIVTNQIEYHPFLNQAKVRDAARKHGMSITAYYGMADGMVFEHTLLKEISIRYQRSVAQIVLRWLIQQDGIVALSKTINKSRAEENLAIFDFELSPEEMNEISELTIKNKRIINPTSLAPSWDH